MNILDKIIAHKRLEVAARREQISAAELRESELYNAPRKSFVGEITHQDKAGIIAEFKRRSPSKGWFSEAANVVEIAKGYETAGASALSILTDAEFFGGSNHDVISAFLEVGIPILRKDFIVDKYQIIEARAIGAAAILLIAAVLSETEIADFAAFAAELKLEVLLEVHEADEIPASLKNISAVGVNNRNLKDFSVDINRSLAIAAELPTGIVKISESGLSDAAAIIRLKKAGFSGFLIGETFMKTVDPATACAELIREIKL